MATHACAQQLDLFEPNRWPKRPYCCDDFEDGLLIRPLATAVKKKYIQANPPHLRIWSIFDIDRPGAAFAWEDAGLPMPNWAATNVNGHAHLAYGLRAPVLVDSPDLRQKPLRYLCAVEHAFRVALEADSSYSGLMTKNPAHPTWRVLRGPTEFYDLSFLAEFVDLPKFIPKRGRNPEEIGLGRNVTLFDWLRRWAYQNIRNYQGGGLAGWNTWMSTCNMKALERNGEFPSPLDGREVWHIAKSVAKWTYQRFDLTASDKRFSELQARRGKQGGLAKGMANENKRATAILMHAKGMKQLEIARELAVTDRTLRNWLKPENSHNQITAGVPIF